jgi:hypothetical protein
MEQEGVTHLHGARGEAVRPARRRRVQHRTPKLGLQLSLRRAARGEGREARGSSAGRHIDPPRTNRTRLVPSPVLTGHVSSLPPTSARTSTRARQGGAGRVARGRAVAPARQRAARPPGARGGRRSGRESRARPRGGRIAHTARARARPRRRRAPAGAARAGRGRRAHCHARQRVDPFSRGRPAEAPLRAPQGDAPDERRGAAWREELPGPRRHPAPRGSHGGGGVRVAGAAARGQRGRDGDGDGVGRGDVARRAVRGVEARQTQLLRAARRRSAAHGG